MRTCIIIRLFPALVLCISSMSYCSAQGAYNPYELKLNQELAYFTGGILANITGLLAQTTKTPFTLLNASDGTNTDHIPSFDVSAVTQNDPAFLQFSDLALYGALALPLVNLVDGKVNDNAVTTIVLYVETLAIGTGAYSLTSGIVSRRRPLTYNPEFDIDERTAGNVKESFFSGHTSISSCAAFCAAKIYSDFHPESKLKPVVWTAAASLPAFIGFARYKAGKHFPSDVITGYVVGASIGYLIPQLHKIDDKNQLSVSPLLMQGANGMNVTYRF